MLAERGSAGTGADTRHENKVLDVTGPSPGGRFNSAFPLWDSTGRFLVSWSQCRLLDADTVTIVPCTDARLSDPNVQTAPPLYSVWMFNPTQNTLLPIMPPVENVMVTDVVAAQPRALQNIILDKVPGVDIDQQLFSDNVGVLDIKSVYDFDGVDTAQPEHRRRSRIRPRATAAQRPARFIRLEKAVSIPDQDVLDLNNAAFGAAGFMREILGYAPVEPDGSVRIKVPANVAFQIEHSRCQRPAHLAASRQRGCRFARAKCSTCNGCHTPAGAQNAAQNPHSHGRQGLFKPVYAGAAGGGSHSLHTLFNVRTLGWRDYGAGPCPHQLLDGHPEVQADESEYERLLFGRLDRPGGGGTRSRCELRLQLQRCVAVPYAGTHEHRHAWIRRADRQPGKRIAASRSTIPRTSRRSGICRARPTMRWASC